MIVNGSMLRRLRREAGLTQRQLAKLAGVSQAHISKIEGQNLDPRLSTIKKILAVLTEGKGKKCHEVMTKNVLFVTSQDKVLKVSELMMRNAISQLPVIDDGHVVGTVTEESIVRNLSSTIANEKVAGVTQAPLPSVHYDTDLCLIRPLLEEHLGVLIVEKDEIVGIITRSDLLKTVSRPI